MCDKESVEDDLFDVLDEALANIGGFAEGGVDASEEDDSCAGGACKI